MAALSTPNDLQAFEREIADFVRRSDLDEAERRVVEVIDQCASPRLQAAGEIDVESLHIKNWPALCADTAQAAERLGEDLALVFLELQNARSAPALRLHRQFHTRYETLANGAVMPAGEKFWIGAAPPITITGLEALMAVQRAPESQVDRLLSGLLLALKTHRAVEAMLAGDGLPHRIDVIYDTYQSRPYPCDYDDMGPALRRLIPAAKVTLRDDSAALLAERKAQEAEAFELELTELIAWTRELHRLPPMFPFHRFLGRRRARAFLTNHLRLLCTVVDLPTEGVSGGMNRQAFERLLRRSSRPGSRRPSRTSSTRATSTPCTPNGWRSHGRTNSKFPTPMGNCSNWCWRTRSCQAAPWCIGAGRRPETIA